MDDVLGRPMLTMAQECSRPDRFVDRGVAHTLRAEWEYVNGLAATSTRHPARASATPTTKDGACGLERRVNSLIRQRRADGHGLALREVDAMLSRDEVLAARLYSGPAFQPVNEFFASWPTSTAPCAPRRAASVTSVATVGHLCRAIRKLAAVATPSEVEAPLYRGVRGESPKGFYARRPGTGLCDGHRIHVDQPQPSDAGGFMTEGGPNRRQLQPKKESDGVPPRRGHLDAVAVLGGGRSSSTVHDAQRPAERREEAERLLSGSLFKAKPQPGCGTATAGLQVAERTEGGCSFLAVNVEPSFV